MKVVIIFLLFGMGSALKMTICHTNGIRCKWNGTDANGGSIQDHTIAPYGGFVRLKVAMNAEKLRCNKDKELYLNLNAGGTFDGSIEFKIIGDANPARAGELIGKFMNHLAFDAMCPGPHEFDLGIEGLNAFLNVAGTNEDPSKNYLVDDNADCYKSKADFTADTPDNWTFKPNFQDLTSEQQTVKMPIFVCANFLHDTYNSVVGEAIQLNRMRRSVVRIFELQNGTKVPVGIIGYICEDVKHKNVRLNLKNVVIGDPVEYVQKESERLNAMGVDIIIALGTAEFKLSKKIGALPLITVVVSGQNYNSFMYNPNVEPESNPNQAILPYPLLIPKMSTSGVVGFAPMVQVYTYGKHLGKLQLNFTDDGKQLLLNDNTNEVVAMTTFTNDNPNPIVLNAVLKVNANSFVVYNQDTDSTIVMHQLAYYKTMATLLQEWKTEFEAHISKYNQISAGPYLSLTRFLEGGDICRKRECQVGGIVADAYYNWYLSIKSEISQDANLFPAAFGTICGNNIRGHLGDVFTSPTKPKEVGRYEAMETLLGKSSVVVVSMTQKQILDMFTWAISQWDNPSPSGIFLQVSHNVRVSYNFANATKVDKSVRMPSIKVEVMVDGFYVDIGHANYKEKLFHVVTTEYQADGGSKFTMIKNGKKLQKTDGKVFAECPWKALGDYLPKFDTKTFRYRLQIQN